MIPIQNVYYMLSYAFQILREDGYSDVATEQFDNVAELCAAILCKGVSLQIKRGLLKDYIPQKEALSALRGKLNISDSIKDQTIIKRQMVCSYDEFSEDSYLNRIIKTTFILLLKADISKGIKKEIKKILVYFNEVEEISVNSIIWKQQYSQNSKTYQMLISICNLVIKGLLQTTSDGSTKLMNFFDEQKMCHLYEKFILEYYRKEFPEIKANASQIPWVLDDGIGDYLPVMQTDITLSRDDKTLIIDAKYYAHTMQSQYDVKTLHSGNLYQIFTYVKNKEAALSNTLHKVSGMLLYAKTDEDLTPDNTYQMSGNTIYVKTLDLNQDFQKIKEQLNAIAGLIMV